MGILRDGTSGGGFRGAFAIKENQIGGDGLRAQLPDHCGDLSAMVSAVIRDVMEHLPAWLRLSDPGRGFVIVDALQILVGKRVNVVNQTAVDFLELAVDRFEI